MNNLYLNKLEFKQEGDTCESLDEQTLLIEACDCGDGFYYVIKTDRWAFDKIDELVELLKKIGIDEDG